MKVNSTWRRCNWQSPEAMAILNGWILTLEVAKQLIQSGLMWSGGEFPSSTKMTLGALWHQPYLCVAMIALKFGSNLRARVNAWQA